VLYRKGSREYDRLEYLGVANEHYNKHLKDVQKLLNYATINP